MAKLFNISWFSHCHFTLPFSIQSIFCNPRPWNSLTYNFSSDLSYDSQNCWMGHAVAVRPPNTDTYKWLECVNQTPHLSTSPHHHTHDHCLSFHLRHNTYNLYCYQTDRHKHKCVRARAHQTSFIHTDTDIMDDLCLRGIPCNDYCIIYSSNQYVCTIFL